jgi:ribonucleoside-diphosphate reductase alpha chain
MDNVNDKTLVPLPEQEESLKTKRRIGLGVLGYGSALMMIQVKYGSAKAIKLTEELCSFIMNEAYRASAELAQEKGPFPLYDREKYLKGEFVKNLQQDPRDDWKAWNQEQSLALDPANRKQFGFCK